MRVIKEEGESVLQKIFHLNYFVPRSWLKYFIFSTTLLKFSFIVTICVVMKLVKTL